MTKNLIRCRQEIPVDRVNRPQRHVHDERRTSEGPNRHAIAHHLWDAFLWVVMKRRFRFLVFLGKRNPQLNAIERPGWLQVFRFSVRAKSKTGEWVLLFGAMRDDERFRHCKIQCFEKSSQRDLLLDRWSDGLIQPTYGSSVGKRFGTARTIVELFVFLSLLAAVLALLSLLS